MKSEVKDLKKYTNPALFVVCIVLVFVLLIIVLTAHQSKAPSVINGATVTEVDNYAYELLKSSPDAATGKGYLDAISYYSSQVSLAKTPEHRFNLQLGFASFLGRTGDPTAGIGMLDSINAADLAPDARYYLYTTYIYLYQRNRDEAGANSYRQRIIDENIYDYIAKLDSGEMDASDQSEDEGDEEDKEDEDEEGDDE